MTYGTTTYQERSVIIIIFSVPPWGLPADRQAGTEHLELTARNRVTKTVTEILKNIDDDRLTDTRRQTDTSMHHWLVGLVEN